MPFAALNMPSLALTQLKTVLTNRFPGTVKVDIAYLNQEFGKHLGVDYYNAVTNSLDHHNSGLGDWFFRQLAFPDEPDNIDAYIARHYPYNIKQIQALRYFIQQKRQNLGKFLDSLIEKYELHRADLIGFTSMFSQNVACFAMARRIKEWNRSIITVVGGANCEAPMGQEIIKNVSQIDYVFSGPALRSFPKMIGYCLDGEMEKCQTIDGLFTKHNWIDVKAPKSMAGPATQPLITIEKQNAALGVAVASAGTREVASLGTELDLDEIIEPDHQEFLNIFENNFPEKKLEPILLFETSRGCWWGEKSHCTFCGLNGATMKYRAMSPDRAITQFENLFQQADRCKTFQAVDNILAREYIEKVLPLIDPPPESTIFYEVKADLSREDLQLLSEKRVRRIQPGIESLATSTLKLMRKGTNAFQNIALLKHCATFEVFPVWNLLVGFPGEGEDVYRKYVDDLPLLIHLPPPNGAFPVRFDRYSPYFTRREEYGLNLQPFDFYAMTYPFSNESLRNLAYYFVDANEQAEYKVALSKWIIDLRDKVNTWHKRWSGADGMERAELYFRRSGSRTVIVDSRAGRVVERELGEFGQRLIDFLETPKRMSNLIDHFSEISKDVICETLTSLRSLGLIFQEGDRYINLVLPYQCSPLSGLSG